MSNTETSSYVAQSLARLWNDAKTEGFEDYLLRAYKSTVNCRPSFDVLVIGETEDGDINRGPKPGLIKQWWYFDDDGLKKTNRPKLSWDSDTVFVKTPLILFHMIEATVVVSERIGPRLFCWKRYRHECLNGQFALLNEEILDI